MERSRFLYLVQRESNTSRIWAALSGVFGLIVLALRQQGCVLCIQKHPNISPPNVLCSFFGAEICSDEALAAENPCWIVKANNNVRADFRPRKTDWGSTPIGLRRRP